MKKKIFHYYFIIYITYHRSATNNDMFNIVMTKICQLNIKFGLHAILIITWLRVWSDGEKEHIPLQLTHALNQLYLANSTALFLPWLFLCFHVTDENVSNLYYFDILISNCQKFLSPRTFFSTAFIFQLIVLRSFFLLEINRIGPSL